MFAAWVLGLAVSITVEGGDDELSVRVLSGCQAALGAQSCALSVADAPSELRADVRFEEDQVDVRVTARATVSERHLVFAKEDAAPQRAIAAGLLVAALSAELAAEQERADRLTAAAQPAPEGVVPAQSAAHKPAAARPQVPVLISGPTKRDLPLRARWLVDVALVGVPPRADLGWQLGLDGSVAFWPIASVGIGVGVRADTSTPEGLDAWRMALRAGPQWGVWSTAVAVNGHALMWTASLEAQIERWRFSGGLSEPEESGVTRIGALLATRCGWATNVLGLFVGVEGQLAGSDIEVVRGDQRLGVVPFWGLGVLIGGRLLAGHE